MAEYIERGAMLANANLLLNRLKDIEKSKNKAKIEGARIAAIASLVGIMKETPAEDVAPVVHGRWIDRKGPDEDGNVDELCSRCMHSDTHSPNVKVPYCWFCGAKMKGVR